MGIGSLPEDISTIRISQVIGLQLAPLSAGLLDNAETILRESGR